MQKLPKAPDRKRSNACVKKGTVSAKERIPFVCFSAVTGKMKTLKSFLQLVEGPTCPFFMWLSG